MAPETIRKNHMFFNAQTTASVPKRHDSVRRSKYAKYSLSGGTKNIVISAAKHAILITGFFLTNVRMFLVRSFILIYVV